MTNTADKLKTSAAEANEAIKKERRALVEKSKLILKEETLKFFEENPKIASFQWGQFEPWRDGEETEFEVFREPDSVTVNGFTYEDLEYGPHPEKAQELLPLYQAVSEFLHQFDEKVLDDCFGHGAKITVDRLGITVDEYEDG